MVIIQIVFCLITLMVSNYVNEEYPRSSIVLLMGISEYFANSIFAAVLVIDTARMGITSLYKRFEKNKCQESYIPKAPDAE